MRIVSHWLLAGLSLWLLSLPAVAQTGFVNWESPHVHPLDLTPDGTKLLAVDTADNHLLVFNVSPTGVLSPTSLIPSVQVGLDPVSVRARSNTEAWVVNQVSDTVSIVNLTTLNVVATINTDDEPADVVFAGSPQRAFISCTTNNEVLVVDPANPLGTPTRISIGGPEPRAMAVNAAGTKVYVSIFQSGNKSTILGGDALFTGGFPPNAVNDSGGPYGGVNPPPNAGTGFNPPQNTANPAPPGVGLIVKKNASGLWMDDNNHDWTKLVSGSLAANSGRPTGWDLPDRDLAIIDAATLSITYATGLMNINMALGVNPATGRVTVVGTDATNERRYEPNVKSTFVRVKLASVDPTGVATPSIIDLNPQLNYTVTSVDAATKALALGDPRGIAWSADGTRGYVTGMGSNNLVVIDGSFNRVSQLALGQGPTGIAFNAAANRVYVLNKFDGSVSVVDPSALTEVARLSFWDPTPTAIKIGRPFLYDTHLNSGLGQVSCGSCHLDGKIDRISWDLGNPAGTMKSVSGGNLGMGIPGLTSNFQDSHPMKGPMTTQTLQDIIGKEPLHWRGDKFGLEDFNGAFASLLGGTQLTVMQMAQFKGFVATLTFPPNPNRNFDNSLPTSLPLTGMFTSGRFGTAGRPLPNGNAVNGLALFRPPNLLDGGSFACSTCHTLPTGEGSDTSWNGSQFLPLAVGPNAEHHLGLVSVDGVTNVSMKIPHLRNMYKKVGFETTQTTALAGFGFVHDGAVDSLPRFISQPIFQVTSDQQVADLTAFMMSFSGSGLPTGSSTNVREPLGPTSLDTHAAVGKQLTLTSATLTTSQQNLLNSMISLANQGAVGLVVKGVQGGLQRGYTYVGSSSFQSDRQAEVVTASALQGRAGPGSELTYTVVPKGTERRIGIDRDSDGFLDRDELDAGTQPDNPASHP